MLESASHVNNRDLFLYLPRLQELKENNMSICLYGFDATLVNEAELLNSRIHYAGMTEERRCKYGIDRPKPYYVCEKGLKLVIRYGSAEIECAIDSVLKRRCEYVVFEDFSPFGRVHRVFAQREEDSFINSDATQLTKLVLDAIVFDVVKKYLKYHDENGKFVDFEAELTAHTERLRVAFDVENGHRVADARWNERLKWRALRQSYKKGELTQQQYQKALKTERAACFEIVQAIEDERIAYVYQGCVQFCVEHYGIIEDDFLDFIEKHQLFLRIWYKQNGQRHLI